MKDTIEVEVKRITKVETEKAEEDSISYSAVLDETTENGRTIAISSDNPFEFHVGDVLSISLASTQKKINEFKDKE